MDTSATSAFGFTLASTAAASTTTPSTVTVSFRSSAAPYGAIVGGDRVQVHQGGHVTAM